METGGFTLKEFLLLASRITGILSNLYDEGIIHRDINPGNIVFNPDTGEIKLIDFGLARKFFGRIKSQKIEGNPLYISPEQTGRTSRPDDYRTDYYSLGAVFYEILTGKPPFTGSDLMELVHAHIAQTPVPPCLVNRNIPEVLSDIIMKLMAKNPEDRYRSPWGLKKDLDECLNQLEKTGKIESFPSGEYEKKTLHLCTGKQLFYNLSSQELDRRLFEIVDHLNAAKELITQEKEKIEFIRLNLMAGKKAKKSIAYREALKYVKQCFEALPDRIWTDYYELAFDLYKEGAEIEYFNGHYDESQKLIKFALI
jgi:serine/threonine protein kinase